MAITLVTSGGEVLGVNGGTTAGAGVLNTTGADLLVVGEQFNAAASGTLTDSKGNTWVQLTKRDSNGSECGCVIWYAKNAVVGSGHTFTITGTNSFSSVGILAFAGTHLTAPFDNEVGISVTTSTTTPIPTMTPSGDNELIIWVCSLFQASVSCTIDMGTQQVETSSGSVYSGALAYQIQTTATPRAATFTHTSYKNSGAAASFLPAAAAGPTQIPYQPLYQWAPLLAQ